MQSVKHFTTIIRKGLPLFLLCATFSVQALVPSDYTSKNYSLQIKEGTAAWRSVAVDSFVTQYTYNLALTAEPQFAIFESDSVVDIEITRVSAFSSFKIKPLHSGITAQKSGQKLTFRMGKEVNHLCVEFNNDKKRPLLIIKHPVDMNKPTGGTTGVRYFGPGYTKVGGDGSIVAANTGTTQKPEIIYFANGAVVEGRINLLNANNVIIKGIGILYNPKAESGGKSQVIKISSCTNITVQGITCVSRPNNWGVTIEAASSGVVLNRFTLMNEIRDGLDIINGQNVTIKHSLIMAHDDAVCLKGRISAKNQPVENILIDSSILANMGGGNGVEIGYESVTPIYKNITFSNLDIIYCLPNGSAPSTYWPEGALTIHPTQMTEYNNAAYMGTMPPIQNVLYKNIRIESCEDDYIVDIFPNRNSPGYGIKNIQFENISVVDGPSRPSRILGRDDHPIDSVGFSDFVLLGTQVKSAIEGNFTIQKATHVTFSVTGTSVISVKPANAGIKIKQNNIDIGDQGESNIQIINLRGQVVRSEKVFGNRQLSLDGLAPGVFQVLTQTEKGITCKKMVR